MTLPPGATEVVASIAGQVLMQELSKHFDDQRAAEVRDHLQAGDVDKAVDAAQQSDAEIVLEDIVNRLAQQQSDEDSPSTQPPEY